ncbi:MAG: hypothetical protein NTX49_07460, partial [Chlamydiae bacterium]|nr:hypothetical protein [Chlamydiota bacterium]
MSAASPASIYSANPYMAFSLYNPFIRFPDTEEAARSIATSPFNRSYIPKIEDLLEVAKAKKLHLFKAMLHTRHFDLHATSPTGETLISVFDSLGDAKSVVIEIL